MQTKPKKKQPEAKAAKPAPRPRPAPPEDLIYVGPNLPGLGLLCSTVFKAGKLPPKIEQARRGDLARLFVPLSGHLKARKELKDPGSGLSADYARARQLAT